MRLGCMPIRAPHAALNQEKYLNAPSIQPIISSFQGLFKVMKRHLLPTFSKQLNVFVFVIGMLYFSCFYF